jgi:ubiquinone/menaquinone biosynthesis C-methylase UbiE
MPTPTPPPCGSGACQKNRWDFHDTNDPVVRLVRDRRLHIAVRHLRRWGSGLGKKTASCLVVCGGVGGEASFLRKAGYFLSTNADFSPDLLQHMQKRDPALLGVLTDTERLPFADGSFDLVLVQDGIHHLRNPVRGVVEMIRVARQAVVVIEPHEGWVARLFGTKIEVDPETQAQNFVFRWNRWLFRQVAESYLVGQNFRVYGLRFWDHSMTLLRLFQPLPSPSLRVALTRLTYGVLDLFFGCWGNMFIGIVVKDGAAQAEPSQPKAGNRRDER